jgi:hypothetical protein
VWLSVSVARSVPPNSTRNTAKNNSDKTRAKRGEITCEKTRNDEGKQSQRARQVGASKRATGAPACADKPSRRRAGASTLTSWPPLRAPWPP